MHATSSYDNSGSKAAKIAIVTLLHAGVAFALISMRIAVPPSAKVPSLTMLDPVTKVIPPEPPKIVDAPPPNALPPIFVPPTVIVDLPQVAPTLTTTTVQPKPPEVTTAGPKVILEVAPPAVAKVVDKQNFHAAQSGDCAVPNYPANSARNGDSGTVGLAVLIGADGHVADAKVTSTSGFRELDRAAVAALSLCKFKPAATNGVPESAWGKIAYVWTLDQ